MWPNLYYRIAEDLIVHTPSQGSPATGVTTSGSTTPVDPLPFFPELHEVPLPLDLLPEIEGIPKISEFNHQVAELRRRVETYNQELRAGPSNLHQPPPQPQLSLIA